MPVSAALSKTTGSSVLLYVYCYMFYEENKIEPVHEISNNVVCAISKASDQPAHTQSMMVKLLTEHHLEFLSSKEGCSGSSESTHVKMPHCWKSHALA